jgi:hypothetical protein
VEFHITVTPRPCAYCSPGNDITVIALWLGHEQLSTTNVYLHAE